MYNRAPADPDGKPGSDKKQWVWWEAGQQRGAGYDGPDDIATTPPSDAAKPGAVGMDALPGTAPCLMRPEGVGGLCVPAGLVDGPLPTHSEPVESPVTTPLDKQQTSPVCPYWQETEHERAGGMRRGLPWLTALQPALCVEIRPALAQEKGRKNLDWCRIASPRTQRRAPALVTRRRRPCTLDGNVMHQVGMP